MLKVCKRILSVSLAAAMCASALLSAQLPACAQENTDELTFTDDFSAYDSTNSAYGAENKVTGKSSDKAVAENGKIKYELSAVTNDYDGLGSAYITDDKKLAVTGYAGYAGAATATNVKLDDNINEFGGFSVDITEKVTNAEWNGGKFVRFMMNDAETTYYEIGITDWDAATIKAAAKSAGVTVNWKGNGQDGSLPYFRKVVGSETKSINILETKCGNSYPVTVSVRASDDKINYSIKNLTGTETFLSGTETLDSAMPRNGESSILSLGAIREHTIAYDNLNIYYTSYGTPGFVDDFSSYDATNSSYGEWVNRTKANATNKVVAENGKIRYEISAINNAYGNEGRGAYIKTGGSLVMMGLGSNRLAANVKFDDNINAFNGFSVDIGEDYTGDWDAGKYVRFMMNDAENTYYEIGITDWNGVLASKPADATWTVNVSKAYHPYFKKVTGGVLQSLNIADVNCGNKKNVTAAVVISGDKISYSIRSISGSTVYFKGSETLDGTMPRNGESSLLSLGSVQDHYVAYDNLKLYYTSYGTPRFSEDFSTAEENTVIMKADNKDVLIAGNDNGGFYPSAKHTGYGDVSAAYIKNGRIGFKGAGNYVMAANLNLEENVYSIDAIELDMIKVAGTYGTANGRAFVRFAVNTDEDTYYELGISSWQDTAITGKSTQGDATAGYPYLLKCEEGKRTVLQLGTERFTAAGTYHARIELADGEISYVMSGSGKKFEGTAPVSEKVESYFKMDGSHVMQIGTGTDDISEYDNIKIWYTPSIMPSYADNSDGTVTVSLVPAVLGAADDNVSIIYAHYDSYGRLTDVVEKTVAANTAAITEIKFDKPTGVGAKGKIMFWDGGIAEAAPLCGALNID